MTRKTIIVTAAAAAVAGLILWGFIAGRQELAEEEEREKPVEAPSRLVAQPDGPAVIFDAATQARADIAVAKIGTVARRREVEALAAVLPAQELIDLRNAYVAARTQSERLRAVAQASRREYERVKALHGDEFNVSTRTLDTAQAQWQADEAAERGAGAALDAVERGAGQKWGSVLARAVAGDASPFRRLADGREVLLRVAAPAGTALAKAPATARVAANDGRFRTAALISPAPMADPRIQGPTFFYAAPAEGLLPGTTLTAYLPAGAERTGGLVPADAVVWWQGKAWFYEQNAPDRFLRRELPSALAVDQGWFVPGLPAVRIVVRGAQMLLSEELRSQIQVGEENR